ncbi:hypothetical protein FJV41_47405 [Myxococcus llanfairpwllgwyngyllgogerychwyrndrobwllllantysiliogogogochensis]|uniref:Uncharacterized protein n=1 Tax=Myxococcus llanfairpwllgwyngyllgogerychwyrndrobwllllantysiliogogogochensis TaxID=2590453 RepID=A0A540WIT5_9BACT|nr:hypothetical protein [Myxococcus llanfairpwllgwyngyllgogerychwyrndrobwllllantysiliogogogochensis]TQF08912.1 hypothetical protein FJV41_47405 [Myxococcus llanfairpwllgwyngyllgogerychwyrndrobwllllantysiliogogogochensis]
MVGGPSSVSDFFGHLLGLLRVEALSPRHQAVFAAAGTRRPTFARHATLESVLAAMADAREETYPEREALTRALVAEMQASPSPAWTAALASAYAPMLTRLRRRIIGNAVPKEDLDQLVLATFLSVARAFPLPRWGDWTAARLRQQTAREVFRYLRKERAEQHDTYTQEQFAEWLPDSRPSPPVESSRRTSVRRSFVRRDAVLVHMAKASLPRSDVEVLMATVVRREKLRTYVSRLVEGDAAETERTYQRLKRQRTRLMQRLRTQAVDVAAQPSGGC